MLSTYLHNIIKKLKKLLLPSSLKRKMSKKSLQHDEMKSMKTYDTNQQKAIMAKHGYFLVLAPPGCGKTDILAERIVQAKAQGVRDEDMLCLTFTNRASRGMKNRVMLRVGEDAQDVFVGNVHRFCSNFIFSNFLVSANTSIIDEDDQIDILTTHNADFFRNSYGKTDRNRINEVINIAAYITQRKLNHPSTAIFLPESYESYFTLAQNYEFNPNLLPPGNTLLKMALFYLDYKEENKYIDFNDILILAYNELHNDASHKYKRYTWIQVDEVQDLNSLQLALIDELTDTTTPFTVMFLGDEQQAIFSFLGAKLKQLSMLKNRCANHILYLGSNYRSPKYLLDIFNTYAERELNVDPTLLPHSTQSQEEHDKWDLLLIHSETVSQEEQRITGMVDYYMRFGKERLAIIVPTNAAADRISDELNAVGIDNFKISGRDIFKQKSYKTLSSFFGCITNEFNAMMWIRLLYGINAFQSQAQAQVFVAKLRNLMMTPMDLFDQESYLARFCRLYEQEEMVYFDTETTGLDVEHDDIVQIAAFKVKGGKKVEGSDFLIFLHTERPIPPKLGETTNPLVKAYAHGKHFSREKGLRLFLKFVGNDAVLGHNVMYDYQILQHNARRTLHEEITLNVYDSLRIAKCVVPNLKMYKLDYLIHTLHLEGKNSHLANDDIAATKELVDYCYKKAKPVIAEQARYLTLLKVQEAISKLKIIRPLFKKTTERLYMDSTHHTLANEVREVYNDMLDLKLIDCLGPKFDIFLKYIKCEWVESSPVNIPLADQIYRHINDMTASISEGDLVGSSNLVPNRVFIMTVHKSKGLEFENVVVLGANDGTYPFYTINQVLYNFNSTEEEKHQAREERREDARKFYVAISRAKKRLCVSYTDYNSYGRRTRLTPFMKYIQDYFYTGRKKKN